MGPRGRGRLCQSARRVESSDCAAKEEVSEKKTKEKRRKQTSRGTATGCVQPRGARGRGWGVWVQGHGSTARQSRGETKAKEEGVGHGREGARRKSGEGGAGGRACLAVCSLGDAVRAAARRRRGDLAAKEEVRKKNNRENKKTYQSSVNETLIRGSKAKREFVIGGRDVGGALEAQLQPPGHVISTQKGNMSRFGCELLLEVAQAAHSSSARLSSSQFGRAALS